MLKHRRIRAAVCGCLLLLSTAPASATTDAYSTEVVASNLNFPWSIAFLPDGGRIVAELAGSLRLINADNVVGAPVTGVPEVFFAGQGGLFDVILDPAFASNRLLYLSYAAGDADNNATTVARARLSADGTALQDVAVIYTAAPGKYAPLHYGGRLAWRKDGALLLTTGDGFDFREQAQDPATHFGKTIAMRPDGEPASAPPLADAPLVWTYGHRNPQGLAVARDGTVYQHEHGPQGGDEVNVLTAGRNYGWPAITYGMDYNGAYVSPFTEHPDMEQPVHVWVPSIAPSGLMVYEGTMFPEWQGDLFVGALVDREVRRLDMANDAVVAEEPLFAELGARIRDIREAPDGSIYILTDGDAGEVVRIARP